MKRALLVLMALYIVALHLSMAAMEAVGWILVLLSLPTMWRQRDFPLCKPLIALVTVVASTWLVHPSLRQLAFMRWVILLYGLYHALMALDWDRHQDLLLKVWSGVLGAVGAYSLFQFLTGQDFFHSRQVVFLTPGGVYKATGFFSMSLTMAYAVGLSLLAVSLPLWQRLPRTWWIAAQLGGGIALATSLARGAWLGIVVATSSYVALARRRWLPHFVGGIVLTLGLALALSPALRERLDGLVHLDRSNQMRVHIWSAYLEMAKDHPWAGVGLFDGQGLVADYYQRLGIEEEFISHAHNVWLQWAAGVGVLGLLAYLWVSAAFVLASWRLTSPWRWSTLMAQIFFHIGSLTENNFFDAEVNHMLVFIWAVVLLERQRSTSSRVRNTRA